MSRVWLKRAALLAVLLLGVAVAVLVPYRPVEVEGAADRKSVV